ncbi:hypothetical protein ACWGB8_19130 [Kitasatospora sp. NPDC054939]
MSSSGSTMRRNGRAGRNGRTTRTARAALGASVLTLSLLATSACGPENSSGDAAATVPAGAPGLGLPANLEELKGWKFEDWEKWAKDYALPAAAKGFWTLEKLLQAKPDEPLPPPAPKTPAPNPPATQGPATQAPGSKAPSQPAPKPSNTQQPASEAPVNPPATQAPGSKAPATQAPQQPGDDGNDAPPKTVNAQPVPHPYTKYAVHGKLFADAPGSGAEAAGGLNHAQCSATVVADPAKPGKSNLVWTAGHCIHQGKGGQFYSNITFIPAFNSSGALSKGKNADESQYAPYGVWPATQAVTSPQWKAEGGKYGDAATHYDFAIVRVQPPGGKSLEETVGGAVPVWFNAPRDQLAVTEYGFPAAPPFDGMELNRCESGRPVRLSYEPSRPPMLAIGCTMTGGSSGGGWLTVKDGKPTLVSNVSVGRHTGEPKFQAGPYLDDVAKGAYEFLSKKG